MIQDYIFLEQINRNHLWTLPNKFFDYLQARLAIAISPNPEMKRLVEFYDLGIVADDFDVKQLAMKINRLTINEINKYKENCDKVAKLFSIEQNYKIVNQLVK